VKDKPIKSTDELFASFFKALDRVEMIESLMRDHAKACGELVGVQSVEFFAEQIGKGVRDMFELLSDIKLAMDVEEHKKL
jgi:predicted nucleotidyltransferase